MCPEAPLFQSQSRLTSCTKMPPLPSALESSQDKKLHSTLAMNPTVNKVVLQVRRKLGGFIACHKSTLPFSPLKVKPKVPTEKPHVSCHCFSQLLPFTHTRKRNLNIYLIFTGLNSSREVEASILEPLVLEVKPETELGSVVFNFNSFSTISNFL